MSGFGVVSVSVMVVGVLAFMLGAERTLAVLEPLAEGFRVGIADTSPWWILGASCVSLAVSVAALVVALRMRP